MQQTNYPTLNQKKLKKKKKERKNKKRIDSLFFGANLKRDTLTSDEPYGKGNI
jgi:hypothetical protein